MALPWKRLAKVLWGDNRHARKVVRRHAGEKAQLQAELERVTAERDGLIRVCDVLFAANPPRETGRPPE